LRCAVLTGAGERVCCAGMDMKTTIPASQRFARGERVDDETFEGLRSGAPALLAGCDPATPLVRAVNGHARAGGFAPTLAAEIRDAVPEATFALEEVALGLYPTGNATVLLPRKIPWVHAHELLLTARPIDARRALEIGLVNRIIPATSSWRERSTRPTRSPPTRRSRRVRRGGACARSCTSRSPRPTSVRRRSARRSVAARTRARRSGRSSRSDRRCGRGGERVSAPVLTELYGGPTAAPAAMGSSRRCPETHAGGRGLVLRLRQQPEPLHLLRAAR